MTGAAPLPPAGEMPATLMLATPLANLRRARGEIGNPSPY
jgi:hypothetical protein